VFVIKDNKISGAVRPISIELRTESPPKRSFYERLFLVLGILTMLAALGFSPFDRVAFCIFAVLSMWSSSLAIALGSRRR
jgi:hypothetical protein